MDTCNICGHNPFCISGGSHDGECEMKNNKEAVNHPQHYGGDVVHEHVKCMVAWGIDKNAFLYNCTKYICRVGKKDAASPLEDLKKALWYLDKAIEQLEKEQSK
jgi:hypothetical protein